MPKPPSGATSPAIVRTAGRVAPAPSPDGCFAATPARPYHHGNLHKAFLDQAFDVIAREGIEAVNLRSLARDIGVSNAAHRRHFETRADLLNAIALDGYRRLSVAFAASLGSKDAVANAKAMAKSYVLWTVQNPAYYAVIRSPEVKSNADPSLTVFVSGLSQKYCKIIKEAQTHGCNNKLIFHHAILKLYIHVIGISKYMSNIRTKMYLNAEFRTLT